MTPKVEEIISLVQNLKKEDKELIQKAYNFARIAHEGQLRKSNEPYFNHVFETAKTLADIGMKSKTIAAGLLHDVMEDTSITEEILRKNFDDEIINLVRGVTKLGTVRYKGIKRKVENLRKFFVSMAEDLRVLTIKLADRLHNIETLKYVRPDKQKRIALETLEIYAPLANRLSMGRLKGRLEDAAFPFAFPAEYERTKALLQERKDADEKYLIEFETALKEKFKEAKVTPVRMDHRVKHLYSLWKKLEK